MNYHQVVRYFRKDNTLTRKQAVDEISKLTNISYHAVECWKNAGVPYKWQRKLQVETEGALEADKKAWVQSRRFIHASRRRLTHIGDVGNAWLSGKT